MKRIVNALLVLCAMTAMAAPAQTFTTLNSFDGTDGANPIAALVQAPDGNLYGTAEYGGAQNLGTIFKITPSGALTTQYRFCSQSECTDGEFPHGGLDLATDGAFYGTTYQGGAGNDGTIFKITPSGALTTLHSFCSQGFPCTDGDAPGAGLVQATNGDLYGTTAYGGANYPCPPYLGCGTIFKITPSGTLTTLYRFCSQNGCIDGSIPYAALVQATNGDFYGTTYGGGANGDYGTIFRITPSGTLTTLYSFCSQSECTDGEVPYAGLVQAINGDLYGTTESGGANGGGTVFKITPTGTLTTLYSFCSQSGCADGAFPYAGLVQATNGDFYGTAWEGGASNAGTIFQITPSGAMTTLYSFCSQTNCSDGSDPIAGLVQATDGNFYGATFAGGASDTCTSGCGTVFSLFVGLGAFVETLPASGKVGAAVRILGSYLTGASSVTFNGTPAVFGISSNSETEITATVPAGASSGKVQVVTPSGTLSSNVPFRVLP